MSNFPIRIYIDNHRQYDSWAGNCRYNSYQLNHAHRLESSYTDCRFDEIQNHILLRNIQASATMNKYDTLYTGYEPRTLIYRTIN